jgi:hypothetical protein
MSDDLFSFVLSNDKSKVKLSMPEVTIDLSPEKVVRLAIFFANLRAEMSPEVSKTFPGNDSSAQSDNYEIQQDRETGESEFRLRIPGLCWTYAYFSNEQCAQIAETLRPTDAPDDAIRH